MNIIEFKNRTFKFIENKNLPSSLLCDYCDFKDLCSDYIDEEQWMACGAVFSNNGIYLVEIR